MSSGASPNESESWTGDLRQADANAAALFALAFNDNEPVPAGNAFTTMLILA
jgi:hypothetical protein